MTVEFSINAFGDAYIDEVNRSHFAEHAASDQIDRYLSIDLSLSDCCYIIAGSDSGLLLGYLDTLLFGHGTRVIVVESDVYYDAIAERYPDFVEHPTITLVPESTWAQAISESDVLNYLYGGNLLLSGSLSTVSDTSGLYQDLADTLRAQLAERSRTITSHVNVRTFVECQLQNLLDNQVSAAVFQGVGKGSTAIVLGGGPSLDEHLPWVLENRERLTVFAASRLCGKLEKIGLRPDVVISVDPQQGMFDLSKEGCLWADTLLVCSYHVVPALLAQWRGPTAYMGKAIPWANPMETDDSVAKLKGPTVSHAAAWLAHDMGFDDILLTGVDLCFSADGSTHATGSIEQKIGALATNVDSQVRTYNGNMASSTHTLKSSISSLASIAESVCEEGKSIINLSVNAAEVAYVEHRPPEEIALPSLRARMQIPDTLPQPEMRYQAVQAELKAASDALTHIIKQCKVAIRYIDRMHGFSGHPPDYAYKHKLDELEDSLNQRFPDHCLLAKHYANTTMAALMRPSGFDEMEEEEFAEWGKQYYRALGKSAANLRKTVRVLLERSRFRLMECSPMPDVAALLAFWHEENTPGRAWQVLQRCRNTLDDCQVEALEQAIAHFETELVHEHTNFSDRIDKNTRDISKLLKSTSFLFDNARSLELSELRDRLRGEEGMVGVVGSLVAGLVEELNSAFDDALLCYENALNGISGDLENTAGASNDRDSVIEAVLLRIVHINLLRHDPVSAIETLGVLTQQSLKHAPLYARLLETTGLTGEAINVLTIYRDAQPEDWRTLEKLAELHERNGDSEAAQEFRAQVARHRPQRPRREAA